MEAGYTLLTTRMDFNWHHTLEYLRAQYEALQAISFRHKKAHTRWAFLLVHKERIWCLYWTRLSNLLD